jgi:phage terminase large subunit-like protein
MPWQRLVSDVACEIDPDTGTYYYREVRLVVTRQAGKTTILLAKGAHRCLSVPRQRLVYTAQTRNMARRRLEEDFYDPIADSVLEHFLAKTGSGPKPGFRSQTGSEHIRFANNSRWWIDAVTKKAGHGPPLDEGHIDEAFAHVDARLEQAMRPAMATKLNAQLWVASAAGDADSTYLWGKVEDGRARIETPSARSRVAYFEWSAEDGADADDPQVWRGCMPSLGRTVQLSTIEAERDSMGDVEFRRAYMGQWPSTRTRPWVIPAASWNACAIDEDDVDWDGVPVWSVDVSPERDYASIAFAARTPAARAWLEVVAHEPGTRWVVDHLVKLKAQFGGDVVVIDGAGPAGALELDLEEAGFEVRRLSLREKVDACGALFDDVLAGQILHGGDTDLDGALAAASKRKSGDAFVWARGSSLADITALYAVTLARYVFCQLTFDDYDIADSYH